MKKILSAAMAFLMALNLASCGQDAGNGGSSAASVPESSASSEAAESAPDTETSDETVLVAYFSWSGNTGEMAAYLAEQTGGDLLEIEPETPYPDDYSECGDVALA